MWHRALLLVALLLAPHAGAAQAVPEGFVLTRTLSVDAARARQPAVLRTRIEGRAWRFYGGVRGKAEARDAVSHSVDVYVGLRPRMRELSMDLSYTRAMTDAGRAREAVALALRHPVGDTGHLRARIAVDPGTGTARTEALGHVRVLRDIRLGAASTGPSDGCRRGSAGRLAPAASLRTRSPLACASATARVPPRGRHCRSAFASDQRSSTRATG